jgi:hypothetical protein
MSLRRWAPEALPAEESPCPERIAAVSNHNESDSKLLSVFFDSIAHPSAKDFSEAVIVPTAMALDEIPRSDLQSGDATQFHQLGVEDGRGGGMGGSSIFFGRAGHPDPSLT